MRVSTVAGDLDLFSYYEPKNTPKIGHQVNLIKMDMPNLPVNRAL